MRNSIVAALIIVTVTMYLLPPAYLMVKSFGTGTPFTDYIWQLPDEIFLYWFSIAGLSSISAVLLYRAEKLGKRLTISIGMAFVWLLLIVNFGIFPQFLLFPGWIAFITITSSLAYPPYFALKHLTKDTCRFSGSILEHLAVLPHSPCHKCLWFSAICSIPSILAFFLAPNLNQARRHTVEMKTLPRAFKIAQPGVGMIGRRLIWHFSLLRRCQ